MCGNWGLLVLADFAAKVRRRNETFPAGLEEFLREMLNVVEMRGAQAGGVNLIFSGRQGVHACRVRALKAKRGNLGQTLFGRLRWDLWKRSIPRGGPCRGAQHGPVIAQGHSRFGTSSAPAVCETHPHQWSPSTRCTFWSWESGKGWVRKHARYTLTITHNGDFDAWKPYRSSMVDVGTLGLWLARVHGVVHTARGDSPKIAGVMELLVCQGIWLHAVRLAYHLHVACHVEQASAWTPLQPSAPQTVPDRATLQAWADVLDRKFGQLLVLEGEVRGPRQPLLAQGTGLEEFVKASAHALKTGATSKLVQRWIPTGKVERFVRAAAEAFRDNDLLSSTTLFLRRAEGTFGLTVSNTLWPQTIVLAARGQPMSVGFGGVAAAGGTAAALWSSERAALNALAADGSNSSSILHARLDLDDQFGEIVQLSASTDANDGPREGIAGQSFHLRLYDDDDGDGSQEEQSNEAGTGLEVCGLHFGKQPASDKGWEPNVLTSETLRNRLTWLVTKHQSKELAEGMAEGMAAEEDDPEAEPAPPKGKDPVVNDLGGLPAVLHEIDLCWDNQGSLNNKSAKHFAELLLTVLRKGQAGEHRGIDLLVFGVESSLWLAQQFCADLTRLFPGLRAVAMSSNVVLGLLQQGPGHVQPYNWVYSGSSFQVGKNTVGLAISHSGTTYPTVWAARFLRKRTEHVFGLASSFDCLLSVSIGQAPDQPFTQRLFSSMAGIRPAEAATLATIAIHHTLSHLLLQCAKVATNTRLPSLQKVSRGDIVNGTANPSQAEEPLAEEQQEQPEETKEAPVCSVSSAEVLDMHRVLLTLYWGASSACGVDNRRRNLTPDLCAIHHDLRRAGRRWSHHITESYWATFLPAAYVLVTVTGGIPPVTTLGMLLVDGLEASNVDILKASDEVRTGLLWLFRFLDSLIYVFLGILVAMTHRVCTRRRLWTRFTTRTLLVVESTVNYKILRAYISKLVALSWRFATISVVGQNGTDHFVHEYTHKAQSDVLVALGLPDGRLHTSSSAEACVLMSAQQAKFIKRPGKGIEILSLGHNPWRRTGLCTCDLTLPTRRPISAGEKILMKDQLEVNKGTSFGQHALAPTAVAQRWGDLLEQHMDSMGMPGLRMSLEELQRIVGPVEGLDFDTTLKLLNNLLETQRQEVKAAAVPLRIERFLEEYLAQQASELDEPMQSPLPEEHHVATERPQDVAPGLGLETPAPEGSPGHVAAAPSPGQGPSRSASKGYLGDSPPVGASPPKSQLPARSSSKVIGEQPSPDARSPVESPIKDYVDSPIKDYADSTPIAAASAKFARMQVLEKNEFLAIVHGDELQNWVRQARHRWAVFSLITTFTGSQSSSGPSVPIGSVLLAWRRVTISKRANARMSRMSSMTFNANVGNTVADYALYENMHHKARFSLDRAEMEDMGPSPNASHLGQHLVDEGMPEAEVLTGLEPTEAFYETRVGSAERLVAWFVLFHAMAEPSARLPCLGFDIGITESRLRVASTPAPVPAHSGSANHEPSKHDPEQAPDEEAPPEAAADEDAAAAAMEAGSAGHGSSRGASRAPSERAAGADTGSAGQGPSRVASRAPERAADADAGSAGQGPSRGASDPALAEAATRSRPSSEAAEDTNASTAAAEVACEPSAAVVRRGSGIRVPSQVVEQF